MNKRIIFAIVLFLSSVACRTSIRFGNVTTDSPPTPEQPARRETPLPQAQGATNVTVLLRDNFSDPGSGWDRIRSGEGVSDYANGAYRILVNVPNSDAYANPGRTFGDVRIDVDALKAGGPDDNDFGVICRFLDGDNFYFFAISSDGYYGIGEYLNGEQKIIGADGMMPSTVVKQGTAINHITAVCDGSTLSLSVNGTQLQTVEAADFFGGDVGLMAGTFDTPGTDILFDNFVVTEP